MPIILPFVIQTVLPVLATILTLLVPVLAAVINFTLTRIPKIPSYIRLIKILYSDIDSSAKERKIITGSLLIIGSILTFIAHSLIPWTGLPLIGAITSPIAGAITVVVALAVLDTIFAINKGYYLERLKKENFAGLNEIEADIQNLKKIFGKSWQKILTTINNSTQKIYEDGSKRGINFSDKPFQKYLDYELEGLNIYIGKSSTEEYQNLNTDFLRQNNSDSWLNDALSFGTGASFGTLAGVTTSSVASSLFVPASIWTTVQGFFGVSTGIAVSATTYSLLTLAAPVGLGVLTSVGIYSGLMDWSNKEQAAKMSKFLSEIIIAALPIAWEDKEFADQEKDTVDRLITTSGIRKKEQSLVWKAREERKTFDQIMQTSILFDNEHREKTCRQSNNERVKHRLILCTAWEIAIADGKIKGSELQLHNRMADKLGISRDEVKEIRRVINLKHEGELLVVVEEVSQPNNSKIKLMKNIREQYTLQPSVDNL